MNKPRKPFNLAEAKIQASRLLKSLHTGETLKAAKRFQRLPEFADLSITEILHKKEIKLKHALTVIALENNFTSWTDLKIQLDFIINGYLNSWFAHYAEAKSSLQSTGGFLLPYKNQFFICHADYIKQLGFDPDDPDWKLIGYDWIKPDDKIAWQRLYRKWISYKTKKIKIIKEIEKKEKKEKKS